MIPALLRSRLAAAALAGSLSMAAALAMWFEGYEPLPYQDPVGIWTVCYGHTSASGTGPVEKARRYKSEECALLLDKDLSLSFAALDRHVTRPLPEATRAALASFIFNVGETKFRNSTLLRKLNAGEGARACDELLRWTYAGGRQLTGLVRRRQAEHALCVQGFSDV